MKKGQIAHLDHDNTNDDPDNLAFLCFSHHDEYDSTTSQSKRLREGEVKKFRDELYARMASRMPESEQPRATGTTSASLEKAGEKDEAAIQPNIGGLRPETIHITHDDESDIWLKSNLSEGEVNNFVGIVLPFSNDPQRNKKTLPANGLRARVTFYRGDNVHEFKRIDSGCWLGHAYRSVNLGVGDIIYLIAAILIAGHGGVILNPRHSAARYEQDTTSVDHLPNGRYEVKVVLIGGEHGEYSEEFWFELEVGDELKCKRINPSAA
ncbi:MAG TPA: hypothetical protein VNZ03_15490 [Terriglobales bacterium]|nr:hypothetical protein [Terriglobales bacterium]